MMLLRMTFIHPQDFSYVEIVSGVPDNLAELSQVEDSMRKLDLEYIWKPQEIIIGIKKNSC